MTVTQDARIDVDPRFPFRKLPKCVDVHQPVADLARDREDGRVPDATPDVAQGAIPQGNHEDAIVPQGVRLLAERAQRQKVAFGATEIVDKTATLNLQANVNAT